MKHTAVGELNARTGLGSAVSALSKLVLSLNILVAVAGAVVFFGDRYWPGFSVPSAFEDYQGGLVGAVSASYIIVLNAAYDRYYEAYARATELTTVGHSIDVGVKVGLVVATIVVQAEPATIVLVTLLLYCLDLVRLWELARSTDSENPIHRPLVKVWIPNCRRHTYRLVLLLVTQVLIATGAIYAIAHWVVPSTDVPHGGRGRALHRAEPDRVRRLVRPLLDRAGADEVDRRPAPDLLAARPERPRRRRRQVLRA